MELAKNSVLALLVVLFAVVYADPVGNVSAISENVTSVKPLENEKDVETTLIPTRLPNAQTEAPALVHASSPLPVEEKTTKAAATMQGAPEKPNGDSTKTDNGKGSASSRNPVYPLVISSAAVVLFSVFLRV